MSSSRLSLVLATALSMVAALSIGLAGCGEEPVQHPPESKAVPKLVENAPETDAAAAGKPMDAAPRGYNSKGQPAAAPEPIKPDTHGK